MAKVIGLGGVFVKTQDSAALSKWYGEVLGLELQDWGGSLMRPQDVCEAFPKGAMTVWSPMGPDNHTYMEPGSQPFMVNFVVDDLDAMLARVRRCGVEPVKAEPTETPQGRFAWIVDPDGLKIELWQPPSGDFQ